MAQDKAAFKEFAHAHGVPTPPSWTDTPRAEPFLVKTNKSSLGQGQRGPFAAGTQVQLAPGEYCERFIFGSLVKAWYWNAELVVAEHVTMPMVQGDRRQTLRQLATARLDAGVALPRHFANVAQLQGLGPESVLASGQVAFADYQYMSPMNCAQESRRRSTPFSMRKAGSGFSRPTATRCCTRRSIITCSTRFSPHLLPAPRSDACRVAERRGVLA